MIFRTPQLTSDWKRNLRKVNVLRSPGGTPLVKRNIESGEGLTPMLTSALKKKFKVSPLLLHGS